MAYESPLRPESGRKVSVLASVAMGHSRPMHCSKQYLYSITSLEPMSGIAAAIKSDG
jgi:hypothetical protein